MRTLLIVLIGFALWAACIWVASLVGKSGSSMTAATAVFVAIWFVAAALNMWIGISHAGYSFQKELPIFLLIFLFPTVVAVFVNWKFL